MCIHYATYNTIGHRNVNVIDKQQRHEHRTMTRQSMYNRARVHNITSPST